MGKRNKGELSAPRSDLDVGLAGGRTVELRGGKIEVAVFPLGYRHVQRFSQLMSEQLPNMLAARVHPDATQKEMIQAVAMNSITTMTDVVQEFLESCVRVDRPEGGEFSELIKMSDLSELLEVWLDISFEGDNPLDPFLKVLENLIRKLTGKSISMKEMLSSSLSSPDTPEETSSTTGSDVQTGENSPTAAGVSPNIVSGSGGRSD